MKWTFLWSPDYEVLENMIENMEGYVPEHVPEPVKLFKSGAIKHCLDPDTGEAWVEFEIGDITEEQATMLEAMLDLVFNIAATMIARADYGVKRDGKWSRYLYPNAAD